MTRRWRDGLLIAAVAVAAAAAGFAYNAWRTAPDSGGGADALGHAAAFPDLEGRTQSLAQWRGKVVVVNFWATWCGPCREEIPVLVRLQKEHGPKGLQLVGIAIDQPEKVRPYAAELGMNFPILIGSVDAIELARTLGNRAAVLPFTVVFSRDGRIAAKEVGAVKEGAFEALLLKLL